MAAIVSGDPEALAATYDHYAPALYGYCRSLLSDPAEAADAVQDTFVVAVARLPGLRDPSRLRPWLYAVARNECHRRLHGPHAAAPFDDDATGISARTADFGAALAQAELRELVWSALAGLALMSRRTAPRSVCATTRRRPFDELPIVTKRRSPPE